MQLPLALVWDNDAAIRERVGEVLAASGFEPLYAASPQEALDAVRSRDVVLFVAGIAAFGGGSYDVLERSSRVRPTAVLAVLEGDGDGRALDAARVGALELLPRPPRTERIQALALRALNQHRVAEELRRLRQRAGASGSGDAIVGRSEFADRLRRELKRLASESGGVLLVGEPGSGRRHAAQALHLLRGERGRFQAIGTAQALGEEGIGTAFVSDVDRWDWPEQERLAAKLAGPTAARVVIATVYDPSREIDGARIHPALVAATSGAVLRIAPLRDRREDVAVLARAFVENLRQLNGLPPIALDPAAVAVLERYVWPGNVKELRDVVETAVILAAEGIVRVENLPEPLRGAGAPSAAAGAGVRADRRFRAAKRDVVDAFERSYLTDLLHRHRGNVTGAAEHAGMLRSALQRLLRKHELRSSDFRSGAPEGGARGGS